VGAGIIGCAIARELAVRGADCTVVDDRAVAGGATRASAGILAPYVEAHHGGPLLDLCVRSLEMYPQWIDAVRRESGMDVEFELLGTLEVATSAARAAELESQSRAQGTWLAPDAVSREYPHVGPSSGARLVRGHGYVAAVPLSNALANSAAERGARFRQARVLSIARDGSSFVVETTTGDVSAGKIVLAAGAWSNMIDGVRMPPLRPVRGQLVQLRWPGTTLMAVVWGPRCYVVPWLDRTILIGATVEDVGFDERPTAGGIRELLDAGCELLPELKDATFLDARAGLRPATPDELPVLGEDPAEPGIFHASGHYRNGVLLAPITGRLIADLVIDGRADPALQDFRVDRFN